MGAGSITCNYDGVHKHKTVIGKDAFIGSDTMMVAPAQIGDGALVAAGSVITEPVPADALGLGRARQVNIEAGPPITAAACTRTTRYNVLPSTKGAAPWGRLLFLS